MTTVPRANEWIKHRTGEPSQLQITTSHFLVQTCSYCNNKFELAEGDVIYGDKWFHNVCWDFIKKQGLKNV
jgi:hypothetical protein